MTNTTPEVKNDPVNHPSHYTQYPVEVIELTRHMTFTRGNAVKYVARAGYKGGKEKELEDLKKARWYIDDDIAQLEAEIAEEKKTFSSIYIPNAKISTLEFKADSNPSVRDLMTGATDLSSYEVTISTSDETAISKKAKG